MLTLCYVTVWNKTLLSQSKIRNRDISGYGSHRRSVGVATLLAVSGQGVFLAIPYEWKWKNCWQLMLHCYIRLIVWLCCNCCLRHRPDLGQPVCSEHGPQRRARFNRPSDSWCTPTMDHEENNRGLEIKKYIYILFKTLDGNRCCIEYPTQLYGCSLKIVFSADHLWS